MSTKAWVTPQATLAVCPKCGKPGTPGTVRPMTSNSSQARWACAYMFGISSTRCGSPATIGRPVEVRSDETAQLLLPPASSAPIWSCAAASSDEMPGLRSANAATSRLPSAPGGTQSKSLPPSSKRNFATLSAPTIGNAAARHSFHHTDPIKNPIWRITAIECQGSQARGLGVENPVFDRPLAERDEGVDAARIGFEHRLGFVAEQREIAPRGARGVHLAREYIARHGARAEPFCVSAGAAPQQRFHLPQPVLRMRKAEPAKRILIRGATNVRNAPLVAPDIDIAE